jgi:hypothetical protein
MMSRLILIESPEGAHFELDGRPLKNGDLISVVLSGQPVRGSFAWNGSRAHRPWVFTTRYGSSIPTDADVVRSPDSETVAVPQPTREPALRDWERRA